MSQCQDKHSYPIYGGKQKTQVHSSKLPWLFAYYNI